MGIHQSSNTSTVTVDIWNVNVNLKVMAMASAISSLNSFSNLQQATFPATLSGNFSSIWAHQIFQLLLPFLRLQGHLRFWWKLIKILSNSPSLCIHGGISFWVIINLSFYYAFTGHMLIKYFWTHSYTSRHSFLTYSPELPYFLLLPTSFLNCHLPDICHNTFFIALFNTQ